MLLGRRQRARRRFASRERDVVEELDVGGGDDGRWVRGHGAEGSGRIVRGRMVMVGNNESLSGNALYPDHMIATGQTCAQTAGRATKKAAMGQCTAHLFRKTRTDATATYSPAWAQRRGGGYVLKGPASRCWIVIAMSFSEKGRGGCC